MKLQNKCPFVLTWALLHLLIQQIWLVKNVNAKGSLYLYMKKKNASQMLARRLTCRFRCKSKLRKLSLTLPMTQRKKNCVKPLDRIRLQNMQGVNDVKWRGHAVLDLRLAGSKGSSESEGLRSGCTEEGRGGFNRWTYNCIYSTGDSQVSGFGSLLRAVMNLRAGTHLLPTI